MVNRILLLHQGLLPLQRIKFSNTGVHILLHGKTGKCTVRDYKTTFNKKIIKRWYNHY